MKLIMELINNNEFWIGVSLGTLLGGLIVAKFILTAATKQKKHKPRTKLGYLCDKCENANFVVLEGNESMACTRCGWKINIP
jgi:DNA-directed RNA polymerase subunit RPC12/RpoP